MMTGRMEIETKFSKNINQRLSNEPDYMESFDVYMEADGKTARTRLNYISNVLRFIHYLKDNGQQVDKIEDLKNITADDVRKYVRDDDNRILSEKGIISDSCKYLRHFSLNCFFSFLEDGNHIYKNPMEKIKTPKNDRLNKKLYLDIDEVKEIEKNAKTGNAAKDKIYMSQWSERDAAIINLGFETGLRVSAIVSINLDDINLGEKYINTIEKGNRPRRVYLNKKTVKVLQAWIQKRNEYLNEKDFDTQALFITKRHTRISPQTIGNVLRAYSGDLNNKGRIHPHTMRSSKANNLYKITGDIEAVRVGLGHKYVSTTQKYVEDSIEKQKKIANINLYGDDDDE